MPAALQPLRHTLTFQPFIGGATPLFGDYIVFGAFQWARCTSPFRLRDPADPVFAWRERMLDLYGGSLRLTTSPWGGLRAEVRVPMVHD